MTEQDPGKIILDAIDNAAPAVPVETPAPSAGSSGTKRPKRDADPPSSPSRGAGSADETQRRFAGGGLSYTDLDLTLSSLPCTDLGNADRFVRRFGDDFLFVPEWGWLAWDGRRWNGQEAEAILARAVHNTVRAIKQEAVALRESGLDEQVDVKKDKPVFASDRLMGWAMASQSNAHVSCIATLARSYLTTSSDRFDREPMAFNVLNGTIRVDKQSPGPDGSYVKFSLHDRRDLITKIAHVSYEPTSSSPVYDKFLGKVQPDLAMRRHLHAWGGLSLTAMPIAKLSFWYGTGRNGKSTLVDAWAHLMGDYAQTIPIESFLDTGRARKGGEASPDIASLPNVRCLRTSEPERGSTLAEGLIKLVTGGEKMRARHLNKDFFEFLPVFKLTMQGNYKPKILGTDEGIWARVLIVPWRVMVPAEERDIHLPVKLRAEASGILNRLLDGLCDFLDHGLPEPEEVLAATQDYREQSDPLGRFITECCDRGDPDAKVLAKELYALYAAWARSEGEPVWSPKGVSRGLQEHGIGRKKSNLIYFTGVSLVKALSDFNDAAVPDESEQVD